MATKKHNTYIIKPEDTLQSIAQALGQDVDYVRRFHNIFAKQEELISMEFPKDLEKLYITPHISEKHIDNIPKVHFLYDKKLAIKPFSEKQTYTITSTHTVGSEMLEQSCHKTVALVKQAQGYHLFVIDTIANLDSEDPDTMMLELSAHVAQALYPLELVVTDDGNWESIHNFKNIAKRWQGIKENISKEFEGEVIEKRLAFYDSLLEDEARCTELLQKDIFLQAYFNNLYANHTRGFCFDRDLHFHLLPNVNAVVYKTQQEVEEYVNQDNQIEIKQTGTITDTRSILDFEQDYNEPHFALDPATGAMPSGSYTAQYWLNSSNNCVQKVSLECTIDLTESTAVSIRIELVE
jgi:hypothetical protein